MPESDLGEHFAASAQPNHVNDRWASALGPMLDTEGLLICAIWVVLLGNLCPIIGFIRFGLIRLS